MKERPVLVSFGLAWPFDGYFLLVEAITTAASPVSGRTEVRRAGWIYSSHTDPTLTLWGGVFPELRPLLERVEGMAIELHPKIVADVVASPEKNLGCRELFYDNTGNLVPAIADLLAA